ncbi:tyrosine-type recombinase/integrase [Nocardia sp. NBC_01327]|uniref:tyrosine-type recombinase/integrase n=1 Tax=Nocardia sp. NBC_01327 TaxID=2903593 RepID=UPI002E0EFDA0|nr:site-specific integrase [Nocardia sp. NBC_01327]
MTDLAEPEIDTAYRPLPVHIEDFLNDLHNANKPANTIRAYRGDLAAFADHYDGNLKTMDVEPIRAFMTAISGQSPATRKRKRAAVSAFCRWAEIDDRLEVNPMGKVGTVTVPKRLPRPAPAKDITRVLDGICARRPRKDLSLAVLQDRVLFETAYVCGARADEVFGSPVPGRTSWDESKPQQPCLAAAASLANLVTGIYRCASHVQQHVIAFR